MKTTQKPYSLLERLSLEAHKLLMYVFLSQMVYEISGLSVATEVGKTIAVSIGLAAIMSLMFWLFFHGLNEAIKGINHE